MTKLFKTKYLGLIAPKLTSRSPMVFAKIFFLFRIKKSSDEFREENSTRKFRWISLNINQKETNNSQIFFFQGKVFIFGQLNVNRSIIGQLKNYWAVTFWRSLLCIFLQTFGTNMSNIKSWGSGSFLKVLGLSSKFFLKIIRSFHYRW